jgi:uncharacterized protein YhfF
MSLENDPAVEAFLNEARAALPALKIGKVQVRSFGGSAALGDTLIALIASGEKTGTFAMEAEFEDAPQRRPVAGGLVVVTRFNGPPVLLYELTEVTRVAFRDIGPQHVAVEGPNARDVEVWRRIHWPYWGAMLQARGREPSLDMPVIFQRFNLLFSRRS